MFLLDWGIPDVVEAHNTLETYCDEYLPLASRAVLQVAVADELTVFGYGFGGVLSMLSTAGHPEVPVRNLVVQATPIDFSELGPAVVFLRRGNLDTDELLDETGNLPAASVYDSLRLLRPTADLSSYADLWQHLHDNEFLKSYQALIGWARDHIPFPGCTFRQVVDLLIRQELLATGRVPLVSGSSTLPTYAARSSTSLAQRITSCLPRRTPRSPVSWLPRRSPISPCPLAMSASSSAAKRRDSSYRPCCSGSRLTPTAK